MSKTTAQSPHALLPLLPRFLDRPRRSFPDLDAILSASGLSRPALCMVRRVAAMPLEGATVEELRPGAPYATRDPHIAWLDEAVTRGYVTLDDDGRYHLREQGRELVERLEREAATYLAALAPIPMDELTRLADRFAAIAAGLDTIAGGPNARILRSRRLAALAPDAGEAPLVRLERAISDLWMARDDAHIGAWRVARFPGPALDLLTRLWRGDVETLPALQSALAVTQDPADVEAQVAELVEQGYVEWRGDTLQPTRAGYNVRETIEAETDELYFQQWPHLAPEEIAWLHDALSRVIDGLPDAPPRQ